MSAKDRWRHNHINAEYNDVNATSAASSNHKLPIKTRQLSVIIILVCQGVTGESTHHHDDHFYKIMITVVMASNFIRVSEPDVYSGATWVRLKSDQEHGITG